MFDFPVPQGRVPQSELSPGGSAMQSPGGTEENLEITLPMGVLMAVPVQEKQVVPCINFGLKSTKTN